MKVNLHITEKCNYHCKQCFAKFGSCKDLSLYEWRHIIWNCIHTAGISEFNIAGGEPLIYPYCDELIDFIWECGAKCSLVTNGSLITEDWILTNGHKLDTLGVSIDSLISETNKVIGRVTKSEKILDFEYLKKCLLLLHEINPNCKVKINTVVSKLNKDEILYNEIASCKPYRWKLLRMHILKTDNFDNSDISVTDEEYVDFIRNNVPEYDEEILDAYFVKTFLCNNGTTVVFEGDMEAAYIIIDARGFLVDNSDNKYTDVIDCKIEDFDYGLTKLRLNNEAFWSRYE